MTSLLPPIERLAAIAVDLKNQAIATGEPARHELPGGLTITFIASGDNRQISCTMWAKMPPLTDRLLISEAFNVPRWITYKDYEFTYQAGWGIMRIKWDENRGKKLRQLAQAHLRPGWSQARVNEMLARHHLESWEKASNDQLDLLLAIVHSTGGCC
jgi:hypothetical protein